MTLVIAVCSLCFAWLTYHGTIIACQIDYCYYHDCTDWTLPCIQVRKVGDGRTKYLQIQNVADSRILLIFLFLPKSVVTLISNKMTVPTITIKEQILYSTCRLLSKSSESKCVLPTDTGVFTFMAKQQQ